MSGATACKECSAGQYLVSNTSTCTACAAGKYTARSGVFTCRDCLPGTHAAGAGNGSNVGASACTLCAPGRFAEAPGASACVLCPAGAFSDGRGGALASTCRPCAAGRYAAAGASACSACAAGSFAASASASACGACAAGSFAAAGASACAACAAGSFAAAGAAACTACPFRATSLVAGGSNISSCSVCASGFAPAANGTCACAPGRYLAGEECLVCPADSVKPEVGDGACTPCAPGLVAHAHACVCPANTQAAAASAAASAASAASAANASAASAASAANASAAVSACVPCGPNEFALPGGPCACVPGAARGDAGVCEVSFASEDDTCVVNRRLPPFALRLGRRAPEGAAPLPGERADAPTLPAGFGPTAPPSASRAPGGACHMGRLPRVGALAPGPAAAEAVAANLSLALQLCGQLPAPGGSDGSGSSARLVCAALAQNPALPASSRTVLTEFPIAETPAAAGTLDTPHPRRVRCNACDAQGPAGVVSREAGAPPAPLAPGAPRQLSVGEPVRLSAERLAAAALRRALCGPAPGPCPALADAAPPGDFSHGRLLRALLEQGQAAADADAAAAEAAAAEAAADAARVASGTLDASAAQAEAEAALWARPWVFCPHSRAGAAGVAGAAAAPRRPGACAGAVPREAWLDPARRPAACAAQLADAPREYKAPVHFCLLNADTERLCQRLTAWRADVRAILCRAAGTCPRSDFFYTPTTFDLASQEFVFDTVHRYYTQDAGRACPDPLHTPSTAEQLAANAEAAARCASSQVQPLYDAVVGARSAKRRIVLIMYHFFRMIARLVQLIAALVLDTVPALTSVAGSRVADMSASINAAATKLAQSCVALVQSIGNLFEAAEDAVFKLFMSRGVGGWLRSLLTFVCQVVTWIVNELWVPVLCPVVNYVMKLSVAITQVTESMHQGLGFIGIRIPGALELIGITQEIIHEVARAVENCHDHRLTKPCVPPSAEQASAEDAVLAVATRCWGTYVTFFGDSQQLSCSAADTCRAARLSAARTVCAACPPPAPGALAFACDEITKLCTCGVPQRQDTWCLANEDCELADASCRVVDSDLALSGADIPCASCSSRGFCFHTSAGSPGLCACRAGFRDSLQRCARPAAGVDTAAAPAPAAYFFLDMDRLCLWHAAPAGPDADVVEFRAAAVIPCVHLDPSAAACTYAADVGLYLVRGGRGAAGTTGDAGTSGGRRRLLEAPAPAEPAPAVWSRDPLCRDALRTPALAETRSACAAALRRSNQTIAALGLERSLPPCALCSLADAVHAAETNPVAALHLLIHAPVVLARHGPLAQAAAVFAAACEGAQRLAAAVQADARPAIVLGPDGAPRLGAHVLEDGLLSPLAARLVERGLTAVAAAAHRAQSTRTASATASARASARARAAPARRLLFFREIVDAAAARRRRAPRHRLRARRHLRARVPQHRRRLRRWLHRSGRRCAGARPRPRQEPLWGPRRR